MRANDAFRLLWHDMFEFSMLGEYIARLCGFELGAYYHSSFVMMLIGRSAYEAVEELTGETDEAPLMDPMPPVTMATRTHLVRIERRIRSVVGHQPFGEFTTLLKTLAHEVEPYWADLFTSLAVQGRMVRQAPATAARELSLIAVPEDYVVSQETVRNSLKIVHHRAADPLISQPQ